MNVSVRMYKYCYSSKGAIYAKVHGDASGSYASSLAWVICFPISNHIPYRIGLLSILKLFFVYTLQFNNLRTRIRKSIITWSNTGQ